MRRTSFPPCQRSRPRNPPEPRRRRNPGVRARHRIVPRRRMPAGRPGQPDHPDRPRGTRGQRPSRPRASRIRRRCKSSPVAPIASARASPAHRRGTLPSPCCRRCGPFEASSSRCSRWPPCRHRRRSLTPYTSSGGYVSQRRQFSGRVTQDEAHETAATVAVTARAHRARISHVLAKGSEGVTAHVPESCGNLESGAFSRVKKTTRHSPGQTGGMRHGETYQEPEAFRT
jgi:hypothetical protein